jgi:hypothetical protein
MEVIVPVDHRFALGKSPALPSAPDKNSRSSVNPPILACSVFTSIAGGLESGFVSAPKTPGSPFKKLRSPGRDLVWTEIELFGQFGQRLLALDSGQSHLRLEGRAAAYSSSCSLLFTAAYAAFRQNFHLSRLFRFPEPALSSSGFATGITKREPGELGPLTYGAPLKVSWPTSYNASLPLSGRA